MCSAKIINFPRARLRRSVPLPPGPVRHTARSSSRRNAGGFILLLFVTIPTAFLYLSGAVKVARHDDLYAALLATVWGFYFVHEPLLRIRVLGPLLVRAGQLSLLASVAGFFGLVYWIVLTHP